MASALVRVGQGLISSLDKPGILERLCQLTTELIGCDCSLTILRDPQDDVYVPLTAHGYPADTWADLRTQRYPAHAVAPMLERLQAAPVIQFLATDRTDKVTSALLRRYGLTACLLVPLRHGGETLGLLSAGFRGRAECFTAVQERVAFGIAQFASLAFENARLVEELETATRLKLEFVSTISHELRTPLGVMLGYAEMLGDDSQAAQRASLLATIRRTGVELCWEPGDELSLLTDRRKLRMILKNLVGNALKFTPSGSVTVRYTAEPRRCTFEVEDTGVGIAPEHLPVIFDMFRQADGSDRRSFSGVGLGLYIVRRLVNQLGGELGVESAPGRGSTFSVSLPRARGEARLSA